MVRKEIERILILLILILLNQSFDGFGQGFGQTSIVKRTSNKYEGVDQVLLINDKELQQKVTSAYDELYNFKFSKAEEQLTAIKHKYPWHPLAYFLLGLNEWWKIEPDLSNESFDKKFHAYMDTVISKSELLYDKMPNYKIEGAFFLSFAYAFESKLYGERGEWGSSLSTGRKSMKYFKITSSVNKMSPEFLFGEALYNYYSVWVREKYPWLNALLWFLKKGDKQLGIEQLRNISSHAILTKLEAKILLARILVRERTNLEEPLVILRSLCEEYPDNSVFHIRYLYLLNAMLRYDDELYAAATNMRTKFYKHEVGYNHVQGIDAAYILGEYSLANKYNENAVNYFKEAIRLGDSYNDRGGNSYLSSALKLAIIEHSNHNQKEFEILVKKIEDNSKKSHFVQKQLREYMNNNNLN